MSNKKELSNIDKAILSEYSDCREANEESNKLSAVSVPQKPLTLTQKESNMIYDVIVGYGIDSRSLAFELITRRLVNKIQAKDHKGDIESYVKEILENDQNLCYTLNGIFMGAGASPMRTHLPIIEEWTQNYHASGEK